MLFSKPCQYAILTMTCLAKTSSNQFLSIRELGELAQVPTPFLGKIITTLSRARLITGRRGPNGGVMLGRPPAEIRVSDIVEAIAGPLDQQGCILGLPRCNEQYPCPLHASWKRLEIQLDQELHSLTLADLVCASGS